MTYNFSNYLKNQDKGQRVYVEATNRRTQDHQLINRLQAQDRTAIVNLYDASGAAHAVQPPDWIKDNIMEHIGQEKPNLSPPDNPVPPPLGITGILYSFASLSIDDT